MTVHPFCHSCGVGLRSDSPEAIAGLCSHHSNTYADEWAKANRIICDFFHRGIEPPRLQARDRDDDFWGYVDVPAPVPAPSEPTQDAA